MRFKLGTFAIAGGGAPFPGLVLEDSHGTDRVVPLAHADFLLTPLNLRLRNTESLLALLEDWDLNFQALAILCQSSAPALLQASLPLSAVHVRARSEERR